MSDGAIFYEFTTLKNEKVIFNVRKILMILPTKRGTDIYLEDGTSYEVKEDYSSVCSKLSAVVSDVLPS